MKKKLLFSFAGFAVVFALAFLVISSQTGSIARNDVSSSYCGKSGCSEESLGDGACFAIAVGRNASTDGSTFFSHNED
jgi:hypothetical protein